MATGRRIKKKSKQGKKSRLSLAQKKIDTPKVSLKRTTSRVSSKNFSSKAHTKPKNISYENRIFSDSCELPVEYNNTYVTLMARDPYWVHAYWEVGKDSLEHLRYALGEDLDRSVRVLRMYDVTLRDFNGTNANSWFDLDVGPYANSWYVNLWNDCVSYCAEIGMRTPSGRFVPVARSNFVTTPRENASGRSDLIWMEEKNGEHLPFVSLPRAKRNEARGDSRAPFNGVKIILTNEDIRAYYARLFPLLRIVISAGRRMGQTHIDADLWQRYLSSGKCLDTYLAFGLSKNEFLKRIRLGASAQMLLKKGASEQMVKNG